MKATRKTKMSRTARRTGKTTSTARLLQNNAGAALRRGRKTMTHWAHEAAEASGLSHLRMPRRSDIPALNAANPLLLGAVGLGLGVAIGTLFPRGMLHSAPHRSRRVTDGGTAPAKSARRRRRRARPRTMSAISAG